MLIKIDPTSPPFCSSPHTFDCFRELTPDLYTQTLKVSKSIHGMRILHLSATAEGGGVAELLKSQIPFEQSLGLASSWYVIKTDPEFFRVTKEIHHLLQGKKSDVLNDAERKLYLDTIASAKQSFETVVTRERPDIIILHDPQVLPFVEHTPEHTSVIFRLHVDLTTPDIPTLDFLRPYIERANFLIVSNSLYKPDWFELERARIIMPAIDPFTAKNHALTGPTAIMKLATLAVNIDRPFITQVSRFDEWKDPEGVMQAYYIAKNEIPDLQLLLAGSFVNDDPLSPERLHNIKKHAAGDPDIFIFSEYDETLINAVQTASDIILQKSLREGFGLTVTEAMWKRRPVIGGRTTGIGMQITDGENGYLVASPEEAAEKIIHLIEDPILRANIGDAAHQTVQKSFLFSRYLLEHLTLYLECKNGIEKPYR